MQTTRNNLSIPRIAISASPEAVPKTPWRFEDLRLDFFETGGFRFRVRGWIHRKTVPYTVLASAREGSYNVRFGGETHEIAPRCYFVAPANTPLEITHQDGPSGVMEVHWVHFHFALTPALDVLSHFELPRQLNPVASEDFEAIYQAATALDKPDGLPGLIHLHHLASRTLQLVREASHQRLDPPATTPEMRRIEPALRFAREHFADLLNVEILAQRCGLSPAHFHEIFKVAMGQSPMQWVRGFRLELAARQLATGEQAVVEIANWAGFLDAAHLSHAFRKKYGVSPREYRGAARLYRGRESDPQMGSAPAGSDPT